MRCLEVTAAIARLLLKRGSGRRNDPAEVLGRQEAPPREAPARDGGGLKNQKDHAPRGDERHQEQTAQHAEAKPFSREGSALRVGEIAQALTLGTAPPEAVLAGIHFDGEL